MCSYLLGTRWIWNKERWIYIFMTHFLKLININHLIAFTNEFICMWCIIAMYTLMNVMKQYIQIKIKSCLLLLLSYDKCKDKSLMCFSFHRLLNSSNETHKHNLMKCLVNDVFVEEERRWINITLDEDIYSWISAQWHWYHPWTSSISP